MFGKKELFGGFIRRSVLRWMEKNVQSRGPDLYIGGQENPYLLRWYVIPRNRVFNVYFHIFLRSDFAEALHDHPWLFNASWLLAGDYKEHTPKGVFDRERGDMKFRWGKAPHRVELYRDGFDNRVELETVTLFITGPKVRTWGFYCPKGFKPWTDYLKDYHSAHEGFDNKGCD